MNETGNDRPISAETVPAVYPDRLHVYLIAKAQFYGANTPIGHRCYNVVELLKNRRTAEGDQLSNIDGGLALQLSEIEALCAVAMIAARKAEGE